MKDIKVKIKNLQDKASLTTRMMLAAADAVEWIELNEKLSAIYREIDALSCLGGECHNEILHI